MSKARTLASTVSTGAVLADGVVNASEIGNLTLPTGGDIVGTTATQTLTNKTLTAPTIASVVNTGTLTLPTSTDTLVGRTTTDTLTNKTLTAPTINGITGVLDINTGTAIASAATVNLNTATGNRVHITGTTAITAVTLTRGPRTVIFDGILTLTHNATTNNLPSAANITTAAGDRAIYESDGTTVYCVAYIRANGTSIVGGGAGDHAVSVNTGSSFGTTNTKIRRFTTTRINLGTAITYADSATLGASFTINDAGIYAVNYVERTDGTGAKFGVSLNSTELTTGITDIAVADILTAQDAPSDNRLYSCACVFYAAATNVVRPHTNATSFSTSGSSSFSIRKVGNV